jgi:hypothetical protein
LRVSYQVAGGQVALAWQSANAAGMAIDGVSVPASGRRLYRLSTHTYLLVATSLDGSQQRLLAVSVQLGPCRATVNGQRYDLALPGCADGLPRTTTSPTASSTLAPSPPATPARASRTATP